MLLGLHGIIIWVPSERSCSSCRKTGCCQSLRESQEGRDFRGLAMMRTLPMRDEERTRNLPLSLYCNLLLQLLIGGGCLICWARFQEAQAAECQHVVPTLGFEAVACFGVLAFSSQDHVRFCVGFQDGLSSIP